MPPRKRSEAAKAPANGPVKKAAPKRVRNHSTIAAKRAQIVGEDGPEVDPYAPTAWGAQAELGTLADLELPSGQRCLAQRPRPEDLVIAGLLDDLDMLAGLVPDGQPKKVSNKQQLAALAKDPKQIRQAIKLMDRLVVHIVQKPELTPEPENPAHKEVGKIYPSSIDMTDKMFLFNWALGGTRDLAKFRGQLAESVENVASVEDVEDTSE